MMKNKTIRLSKTALARKLGVSLWTVKHYAAKPGAPRPDRFGKYHVRPFRDFLVSVAPKITERLAPEQAADESGMAVKAAPAREMDEILKLRRRKLALEIASLEREDEAVSSMLLTAQNLSDELEYFGHLVASAYRYQFGLFWEQAEGKTGDERKALLENLVHGEVVIRMHTALNQRFDKLIMAEIAVGAASPPLKNPWLSRPA
jgi:hypothetical protein